jgi:hypothetical protein
MDLNDQQGINSIREAVDNLLYVNCNIKRMSKRNFDKQRDFFISLINQIQSTYIKTNILYTELSIDFSSYDEKFYEIIDNLLYLKYGKDCFELISFYLWDRINPDQTINTVIDSDGNEITMLSPLDLWNLMLKVNPNLE